MRSTQTSPNGTLPHSDTQPFSEEGIYDEYMKKQSQFPKKVNFNTSSGVDAMAGCRSPVRTHQDSGNIDQEVDISPGSLNEDVGANGSGERGTGLSDSSPSPIQNYTSQQSQVFLPSTPNTVGKKRRRNGDIINEPVTPGLPTNPFARNHVKPAHMMGLSQVFGATQAITPHRNDLQSDPLTSRPTPNFYNAHSPPPISSPLGTPLADAQRAMSEPRSYIPMVESQQVRDQLAREARSSSAIPDNGEGSLEDTLGPRESQEIRNRLKAARVIEAARKELANITFPAKAQHLHPKATPLRDLGHAIKYAKGNKNQRYSRSEIHLQSDQSDEVPDPERSSSPPNGNDELRSDPQTRIQVPGTTVRAPRNRSMAQPSPSEALSKRSRRHTSFRNPAHQASHAKDAAKLLDPIPSETIAIADSQESPSKNASQYKISALPPPDFEPSSIELLSYVEQSPSQIHDGSLFNTCHSPIEHASIDPMSDVLAGSSPPALRAAAKIRPQDGISDSHQRLSQQHPSHSLHHGDGEQNGLASINQVPEELPAGELHPIIPHETPSPCVVKPLGGDVEHTLSITNSLVQSESTEKVPSPIKQMEGPRTPETSPAHAAFSAPATVAAGLMPTGQVTSPAGQDDCPPVTMPPSLGTSHAIGRGATLEYSNSNAVFETARTRVEAQSEEKDEDQRLNPMTPLKAISHPENTRIRTLTEIGADASPPNAIRDVDMDISLIDSQENREYRALIDGSSPVRRAKRKRRGVAGALTKEGEQETLAMVKPRESKAVPVPTAQLPLQQSEDPVPPTKDKEHKLPKPQRKKMRLMMSKPTDLVPHETIMPEHISADNMAEHMSKDGCPIDESHKTTEYASCGQSCRSHTSVDGRGTHENPQEAFPSSDVSRLMPQRVFALFKGGNSAFYPATFHSTVHSDHQQLKVEFDDGTDVVLEPHFVCSLELRRGDTVKVDLPKMRKNNYTVIGYKDGLNEAGRVPSRSEGNLRSSVHAKEVPKTDVFGHATIILTKKRRDGGNSATDLEHQTNIDVPTSSIYIVQSNWIHFKDRLIQYNKSDQQDAGLQTPALGTSFSPTSTSRNRRIVSEMTSQPVSSRSSSVSFKAKNNLFSGMTFAVSYVSHNDEKECVINRIKENGGTIVTDGFEALFDINSPEAPSDVPPVHDLPAQQMQLTQSARQSGFACLLADQYSRRAKYMQALALGLPCLAGRWVEDCVAAGQVLEWGSYLLPAGESSFLHGAVRSRVLQPYAADAEVHFPDTVDARSKLLAGRSVLFVMGKGRAETRRRAYLFLTHALGAARIARVQSLEEARTFLLEEGEGASKESRWNLIHADGDAKLAEKTLFAAGQKKKKSCRDLSRDVKVIDDEFVVQSLILGKLIED